MKKNKLLDKPNVLLTALIAINILANIAFAIAIPVTIIVLILKLLGYVTITWLLLFTPLVVATILSIALGLAIVVIGAKAFKNEL